jgi:predicted PurR-regulated permease PerM
MHSLKFKLVVIFLMAGFGFFLVPSFMNFLIPLYLNPYLLLSLMNLWVLVLFMVVLSLWIYALVRMVQSLYNQLKHGSVEEQVVGLLEKQQKSLGIFINVAEKEFMRRNISKKTFEDIQRIAGKKMVEIKAKRKELEEPEAKESKKEGKEKKENK